MYVHLQYNTLLGNVAFLGLLPQLGPDLPVGLQQLLQLFEDGLISFLHAVQGAVQSVQLLVQSFVR